MKLVKKYEPVHIILEKQIEVEILLKLIENAYTTAPTNTYVESFAHELLELLERVTNSHSHSLQ